MLRKPLFCCVLLLMGCGDDDKTIDSTATVSTTSTTTSGTTSSTTTDWPTTPDDYIFGPTSYMHQFLIPDMGVSPCCRDWGSMSKDNILDGTNNIDNSLAQLRDLTNIMGLDLQATIDGTIETEGFVALLDHQGVPAADGDYDLAFFRGKFVNGSSYFTAIGGGGEFEVSVNNFDEGTGRPRALFDSANLTNGQLTASGGSIEIAMPIIDNTLLILPMQDVDLQGTLTSDGQISNGTLSGYVTVDDFYNGYNAVVADLCGCLGLTGDLYIDNGTATWDNICVSNPASLCPAPQDYACVSMAGDNLLAGELCAIIPGLMGSTPDLDTDGDTTTYEALSVGFVFNAASADITGLR